MMTQSMSKAMAVGLFLITPMLFADDFWTKSELKKSSWTTVYTTASGKKVPAQIKFNGSEGSYTTKFGKGQLTDIQYGIELDTVPGPSFQITGTWSLQGDSGNFTFSSKGRDKFKGSWQGDNGNGTWLGTAMYGGWQKDPNSDRMFCEYRYPSKNDPTTINVQIVIWYPNDPDRCNYYYFANKSNKIWGRCLCPKSPAYDPDVMQWSKLNGDDWEELDKGDCPSPADGDSTLSAIDNIQDPPI